MKFQWMPGLHVLSRSEGIETWHDNLTSHDNLVRLHVLSRSEGIETIRIHDTYL